MYDERDSSAGLSAAVGLGSVERGAVYAAFVARAQTLDDRLRREREVISFEIARRKRRVAPQSPSSDTFGVQSSDGTASSANEDIVRSFTSGRGSMFPALWTLSLRADVNSDRLGAFWWVGEQLAHVLLITAAVLFLHGPYVFDMPSFPFAVVGVIIWLTFRTTLMAVLAGPAGLTHVIDHPRVSSFDVVVIRSLKGVAVNSLVGLILMTVCILYSVVPLPENLLKVVASITGAYAVGFGCGLIARHGALQYSGLRKVYPMLIRLLAIVSGLFFVSEQAPGFVSSYMLWNPILHLSQFARSGWFHTYETDDASFAYTLGAIGFVLLVGLACAVSSRRTRARLGEPA